MKTQVDDLVEKINLQATKGFSELNRHLLMHQKALLSILTSESLLSIADQSKIRETKILAARFNRVILAVIDADQIKEPL